LTFNTFNLDARLNAGIQQAGYTSPTPIQVQAIPLAMANKDIIGTAQTGTGKTATFVLPMLHQLLNSESNRKVRALIITPTRELADQINQTIKQLSKGTRISTITVYGGVSEKGQIDNLRRGADIVVACPGRLLDLINQGKAHLGNVETLVLDEADRMLDMGFLPDIKRILKHIPNQRQTLLFSATFAPEIEKLSRQYLKNPERVAIGIVAPAHTVTHKLYPVAEHLKREFLVHLLYKTKTRSVLIFTRTKHRAKRLAEQLGKDGYKVTSLHGNRSQSQRSSAISGFKAGTFEIMVATDVASRGLDIEHISHVINYDMPDTEDAYIHRIGRTGRATREGEAFTFVTREDEPMVRRLERVMKQSLERATFEDFDYAAPPKPKQPREPREARPQGQRNSRPPSQRTSNGNGSNGHSRGSRPPGVRPGNTVARNQNRSRRKTHSR
jgi:ATP-dependent RNA helicase RhlE